MGADNYITCYNESYFCGVIGFHFQRKLAPDLSNFEQPYNNPRQLSFKPILYQISRDKCWMPNRKGHHGCKCDLNAHKLCERNLLMYNTIWNRCDHNCKSSPDCPNLNFAYCCSKDTDKKSCPAKMKRVAGPSHKYVYPGSFPVQVFVEK